MQFIIDKTSKSTLKKQDTYVFTDIPEKIWDRARKRTKKNPLYYHGNNNDYLLYWHIDSMRVVLFLSFTTFIEETNGNNNRDPI